MASARKASPALNLHLGLVYVFLYVPIAVLMVLSFNRGGMPTAWTGFSLDWYVKLFNDRAIIDAFVTSMEIAIISTVAAVVQSSVVQ